MKYIRITMKKVISFIVLFFVMNFSFGQIYKLRTNLFSSRHVINDSWTDWTPWVASGILIVADIENQRVKIYSATPQTYDMIDAPLTDYDNDGLPIYTITCIDENGSRCKMIWYNTKNDGSYVIYRFSNLELMYKVVKLD